MRDKDKDCLLCIKAIGWDTEVLIRLAGERMTKPGESAEWQRGKGAEG